MPQPEDDIDEVDLSELQDAIMEWWGNHTFDFPWRNDSIPEWQRLVTEVLLQRTRARSVAKMYTGFFARFPTTRDMHRANENDMREAIYPLGLLWRAKYLAQLGTALHELDGAVPETRDALVALPGVGPYVSGAFLALHRNEPAVFVDANIVRLLARYVGFDHDGETRRKKWFLAIAERLFTNAHSPRDFGYAVLDFTREVCGKPPRCEGCPASLGCAFATQ